MIQRFKLVVAFLKKGIKKFDPDCEGTCVSACFISDGQFELVSHDK